MLKLFIKISILICLNFILTNAIFPQTADPKLLELRNQFAVNYLKPEAHFALAHYYLDKNDKLQAFSLMEYARRYRFPEDQFNAAFVKFFGDNSAEPDAKAKQSFEKAYELLKQKKPDEAEQAFITAANLAPKSAFIQGWVGRFFFKVKLKNAEALKYYFNAYFLDPHAYETEYVESRIRYIGFSEADVRFAELIKSGRALPEISIDTNPLIVGKAVDQMAKVWKKEYLQPLLKCMENDDSLVRWFAFATIIRNAGAASDELIAALLNDTDLRKRGLAAYALINFQKEKSFDTLKKMLADKAELIRFDAVSALALKGGEKGLEILRAHRKIETSPVLQKSLDQLLQSK